MTKDSVLTIRSCSCWMASCKVAAMPTDDDAKFLCDRAAAILTPLKANIVLPAPTAMNTAAIANHTRRCLGGPLVARSQPRSGAISEDPPVALLTRAGFPEGIRAAHRARSCAQVSRTTDNGLPSRPQRRHNFANRCNRATAVAPMTSAPCSHCLRRHPFGNRYATRSPRRKTTLLASIVSSPYSFYRTWDIMTVRAELEDPAWGEVDRRAATPSPPGGDSLTRLVEELMRPGAIYMAAQPIVGLADGSLLGYELLARSSIPCSSGPDQWLAHASYLGVRTEFELACLQAACDKGPPPEDVRLFVNLSPRTLLDPRLDQILNGLPPRVIEITEHEAVSDYQELRRRLQSWTTATTMLAIDDVGSGYSSMSHVIQLHPQYIKIDRSLVHKAHRDPNKLAVLRGLVGFSRQCGVTSLAEGVETSEELNALRAVGVDLVQGYLLARPDDGWPQPRHWRATETRVPPLGEAVDRSSWGRSASGSRRWLTGTTRRTR